MGKDKRLGTLLLFLPLHPASYTASQRQEGSALAFIDISRFGGNPPVCTICFLLLHLFYRNTQEYLIRPTPSNGLVSTAC